MVCAFWGNRNAPESVRFAVRDILKTLVESGVCKFYVGNEGNFDRIVLDELKRFGETQNIEYYVVLAKPKHDLPSEITIYPEGIESALPKFAIDYRNRWILNRADVVVTYVTRPGGAAKYKDLAIKKGKTVFELTEPLHL